ncbi:glucose-1-phosphate cytidylyltransferase [bacterium]|nr:glucose-1-phosphate cytidylyltransferase [bacterium]
MKAVILAGGLGTRLSEETKLKPKPMVEIGGRPILWHIMKSYSSYGVNDFVICCGYKGYLIKEYFANYFLHESDVTFHIKDNKMQVHQNNTEPWSVTLVNTGENTMTGGRLKRVRDYIKDEEAFCFTYGDGVSNIDIAKLIQFHRAHNKQATITVIRPSSRYGVLKLGHEDSVENFLEKPIIEGSWINGGYFVLSPAVIDRISDDTTIWEREPLSGLAKDNQLTAFKHNGFWQPMDTMRDKIYLDDLWKVDKALWKVW